MNRAIAVLVAAITLLLVWPLSSASAQSVFGPGQDPLAGSRVFGSKQCVKCHAVNGVGGKVGPDLGRVERPRTFYDLATAMWNHLPQMLQRMDALGISRPRLEVRQTEDLIAFLYTLSYFDPPGNARAGERYFAGKRCVVCHQVGGAGGVVGPNLDFLKQFGSPIFIAAAIWNHGPQMLEAMKARAIERPAFIGPELQDLIAYLAPASAGPQEGPVYVLPGRAPEGKRLFRDKRCIECHSVGREGGRIGPDLAGRGLRRSLVEFAAAMWNKAPTMMAAMKPREIAMPQLRPEEMADIVAYLYSVGYFAEPGNVANGRKVASEKACLRCHAASGERGKGASDLARAKDLDSPAAVITALWNHAVIAPPTGRGQKGAWPELRPEDMGDLVAFLQSLRVAR
jgi:mono/diheme cytochrome c family protein